MECVSKIGKVGMDMRNIVKEFSKIDIEVKWKEEIKYGFEVKS